MEIHPLHRWDVSAEEAVALQKELAERVEVDTPLPRCRLIAGCDVSYDQGSSRFHAGVVVLRTDDLSVVERCGASGDSPFPYVPGLLSFREAPILLEALARVESAPDAVMCDGQGTAHPRRLGIASHLGLWLGVPTIGAAKSRLVGTFEGPGLSAGSTSPLLYRRKVVGDVVRTKDRVQPLYVSPGHRVDRAGAVRWVLATCRGYRLPEPTRQAHLYVNELRRGDATV